MKLFSSAVTRCTEVKFKMLARSLTIIRPLTCISIKNHLGKISYNQTVLKSVNNQLANGSPGFVRCYAKGKDKKKDKSKKPAKVEINESQLQEVLNLDSLKQQMQKAVDVMRDEYAKNLSLRSTTGAIETLKVNVEGVEHELQELGQITRKNPKTIIINMIEFPQTIQDVIKAIQKSGMNLNPQQDGTTLFIPVPKVTKEHRENLSKNAKTLYIKCRDSIKDIQNSSIKKVKKKSEISIDDSHNIQNQITAIADQFVAEAEKTLAAKQNELVGAKD